MIVRSLLLVLAIGLGSTSAHAQLMPCQSPSAKSAKVRDRAVAYASSPVYVRFRANFGIGPIDTSQVAVVGADSVCDAVTRAVNAVSETQRSASLIVVRFGDHYAATPPEGDDIIGVYILDHDFIVKTVVVGT